MAALAWQIEHSQLPHSIDAEQYAKLQIRRNAECRLTPEESSARTDILRTLPISRVAEEYEYLTNSQNFNNITVQVFGTEQRNKFTLF